MGEFGLPTLHHYFFNRLKLHHGSDESLKQRPVVRWIAKNQFQLVEMFGQRKLLLVNLYRFFHSKMRPSDGLAQRPNYELETVGMLGSAEIAELLKFRYIDLQVVEEYLGRTLKRHSI